MTAGEADLTEDAESGRSWILGADEVDTPDDDTGARGILGVGSVAGVDVRILDTADGVTVRETGDAKAEPPEIVESAGDDTGASANARNGSTARG
jgi:hypothetical protein